MVQAATDTPPDDVGGAKPPWRERKLDYLEHIRRTPTELLRVTVADKVDNVRCLLADSRPLGESVWTRFNAGKNDQVWYYRSTFEAYGAAGFRGPLVDELTRLLTELEQAVASVST